MQTIVLTPQNFTFAQVASYDFNGRRIDCSERVTGYGSGKKTVYTCTIDGVTYDKKDITFYKRMMGLKAGATRPHAKPAAVPVKEAKPATRPAVTGEIRHAEFEHIMDLVDARRHVYLYGPAGTGKSAIAKQVAREMGLPFYYATSLFDIYALEGFKDAAGQYQETTFYKAYKDGGVFLLDELDNSDPAVLKKLNGALSNGAYAFPCGMVEINPNFVCIATGNTIGKGATEEYTANVIDVSSLNRFTGKIEINYDIRVERAIAKGDCALVEFVEEMRKAARKAGQRILLTYREIEAVTEMRSKWTPKELIKYVLFPTLSEDDRATLKAAATGLAANEFYNAL